MCAKYYFNVRWLHARICAATSPNFNNWWWTGRETEIERVKVLGIEENVGVLTGLRGHTSAGLPLVGNVTSVTPVDLRHLAVRTGPESRQHVTKPTRGWQEGSEGTWRNLSLFIHLCPSLCLFLTATSMLVISFGNLLTKCLNPGHILQHH